MYNRNDSAKVLIENVGEEEGENNENFQRFTGILKLENYEKINSEMVL
jgi:hypothetical protein